MGSLSRLPFAWRSISIFLLVGQVLTTNGQVGTRAWLRDSRGAPLVSPVTLGESTVVQKNLATVGCVPSNSTGSNHTVRAVCTCSLISTAPAHGPFDVKLRRPQNFTVYYVGAGSGLKPLDYRSVRAYMVNVECHDQPWDGVAKAWVQIEVDILPNNAPHITEYPTVNRTVDVMSNLAVGSVIYALTVQDKERDVISYSMTQNPNRGYLTIGSSDGIIKTAVDLRSVASDSIVCTVSVSDGKTTVSNFIVNVMLLHVNTRPNIANLPASIDVKETQTAGLTLMTLVIDDITLQGNNLVTRCSVDPSAESYKFSYDDNSKKLQLNVLATGQTLLDYETTNKYLITCVVSDGYLNSQGDVLTVNVVNVNEPPVFSQSAYHCTMAESNAGVSGCDLGVSVSDPDHDTITKVELLAGNNPERFQYSQATDRLTFSVDYDVDGVAMPTQVVMTIGAVDSNFATGTATVYVNIRDVNDNTCTAAAAGTFNINQATPMGLLGSLNVNDADLTSPNNAVAVEVVGSYPALSLNYIAVLGNGQVHYVGLIPETDHGTSFALTVRCKDGGSPSLSATSTVLVTYFTTPTTTTTATTTTITAAPTTTTPEPSNSIWNGTAFVAVFSVLMALLGLGLLAALYYFFCRNAGGFHCPDFGSSEIQPSANQVKPKDELRWSNHAWRQGDHYETGIGYEGGRPNDRLGTSSGITTVAPALP